MRKNSQRYHPNYQTMNTALVNWASKTHILSPCPSRPHNFCPNSQLMKPALTNWAFSILTNLKQQWKNMKRYLPKLLIQRLMISKLQHIYPSIRIFLLLIHTTLSNIPTNLLLISLNDHFSSHHIFIHIPHSLPNTYDPWP